MSEFEDSKEWDKSIRACAEICMEETLEDVLVCDDYTDPSCFCDINDGDPFGERQSVLSCIQTHCHMTEDPEPALFVSVCSEFHATESTTSEPSKRRSAPTATASAANQTQGADAVETSSPQITEPSDSDGGLPTGAIAGIAVGAVVAVLLLAAFLFRRRIRGRFESNTAVADEPKTPGVSELEAGAAFAALKPDAKDDPYLAELGGTSRHNRYPSEVSELEGTATISTSSRRVSPYYGSGGGIMTPSEMSRVEGPDAHLSAQSPSTQLGGRNSGMGR